MSVTSNQRLDHPNFVHTTPTPTSVSKNSARLYFSTRGSSIELEDIWFIFILPIFVVYLWTVQYSPKYLKTPETHFFLKMLDKILL